MPKVPAGALDYYLRLGPHRSYEAVAEHYGVSRKSVARRAAQERWQDRVREVQLSALAAAQEKQVQHATESHKAFLDVCSSQRVRGVATSLLKEAMTGNVSAARIVLDRVLPKPRAPVGIGGLAPNGLGTGADVRAGFDALLKAVVSGTVSADDAQRLATILEAARRSVETEDIERRLTAIERARNT